MNIEHVKLFIHVALKQNISKAGEELGISPAVASVHINKLEESLGVRLLHRTTRKVSLTEEGERFFPHAEEMIATMESAIASLGKGNVMPSGTLRVTASASFGRMHLLPALPEFLRKYPKIKVDLKLSDRIVDLVEGGFDIAIRNSSLKNSSLIARRLTPDTRVLCASPSYLLQHGVPTHPKELHEHNCITLTGADTWQFHTEDQIVSIKATGNFRCDNGEAIRDACISGVGISINSKWNAYEALRRGELVEILTDYPLASETAIWVLYSSSRQLAPKVRVFIDYFHQYFSENTLWE